MGSWMTGSRLALGFAGAVLMYRFGVPFYPEESRAGSKEARTRSEPPREARSRARRDGVRSTNSLASFGHMRGTSVRRRTPKFGSVPKRMNGLEPSTFCMARTWREVNASDKSRELGRVRLIEDRVGCQKRPACDSET